MADLHFEEKIAAVTAISILIAFLYYAAGTSSFYSTSFYASATPGIKPIIGSGVSTHCPFEQTCANCPIIHYVANKEYMEAGTFDQRIVWTTNLETTDSVLYYRLIGSGTFNEIPVIGIPNDYLGITEYETIFSTGLAPGLYEYYVEATNPTGTSSVSVPRSSACYKIQLYDFSSIPQSGVTKKNDFYVPEFAYALNKQDMDANNNGKPELVVGKYVLETTGDNYYTILRYGSELVKDSGDLDNDGLKEILLLNTGNNYVTILESTAPDKYPSEKVWYMSGVSGIKFIQITDLDKDGKKELSMCMTGPANQFVIEENIGTGDYYDPKTVYSLEGIDCENAAIANDMDGDGRSEFAVVGWVGTDHVYKIFENSGDDSYTEVWSFNTQWTDGFGFSTSSPAFYMVDIDGDGLEELITGGNSILPLPHPDYRKVKYFVIESVKKEIHDLTLDSNAREYKITHQFELDPDTSSFPVHFRQNSIATAGNIVFYRPFTDDPFGPSTTAGVLYVLKFDGYQFRPIWYHYIPAGEVEPSQIDMAAGDYDQDSHPDLLFQEGGDEMDYQMVIYERD